MSNYDALSEREQVGVSQAASLVNRSYGRMNQGAFGKQRCKGFPERMREARIVCGYTQRTFEDLIGRQLPDGGLCTRWEAGRSEPSLSLLPKIADVLQVSVDWLLTGTIHSFGAVESRAARNIANNCREALSQKHVHDLLGGAA